jgi:hypothetical protein
MILREAEAYRAENIHRAQGETERFLQVLGEYQAAEEITRKRWLLETLEKVLRQMDKIILDDIVCSKIREQLGLHDLVEVIASNGEPIIQAVTAGSHEAYRRWLKGKTTLLLPPSDGVP